MFWFLLLLSWVLAQWISFEIMFPVSGDNTKYNNRIFYFNPFSESKRRVCVFVAGRLRCLHFGRLLFVNSMETK